MTFFYALDLIGTMAFAISGTLAAIHKKMDPFGVFIIAFVTAVGGGTLRDVLIGNHPMGWMLDLNYVYAISLASFMAIVLRHRIAFLRQSLFLFDTIGLGIFTIIGTEIGLQKDLNPIICVFLGTMTATFGGVLRDILCNEIPIIFQREIYASACILGAVTFLLTTYYIEEGAWSYMAAIAMVILVRLLAVKFKWSYPKFHKKEPLQKD